MLNLDSPWGGDRRGALRLGGGRPGFLGRLGFWGGPRAFRAARLLASGDLQLIILALVQEKPRHGYDIIKALEERSSGIYAPSPGVVYPALTFLEEAGFAVAEANGNKKLYSLTPAGTEHLARHRGLVDEMLEQLSRFGRKMARVQRHFDDEAAENEFDESAPRTGGRREWRRMKSEFRDIREELRAAVLERIDAPLEEQTRVLEILRRAVAEIRRKKEPKRG